MDDRDALSEELKEAVKEQKLEHVETTERKAEITLKFKSDDGQVVDFPVCEEHGQLIYTEGSDTLTCEECDATAPVPKDAAGNLMKPFISKA